MDLGNILFWGILICATLLPIIFSNSKFIRLVCIVLILVFAWGVVYLNFYLAIRNVDAPSLQQAQKQASYGDAWQAGAMAVQKEIDSHIIHLTAVFVSSIIIALFSNAKIKIRPQITNNH